VFTHYLGLIKEVQAIIPWEKLAKNIVKSFTGSELLATICAKWDARVWRARFGCLAVY